MRQRVRLRLGLGGCTRFFGAGVERTCTACSTRARARAPRATAGTSTTLALKMHSVLFGAGVERHMHGVLGPEHVHERYVRQRQLTTLALRMHLLFGAGVEWHMHGLLDSRRTMPDVRGYYFDPFTGMRELLCCVGFEWYQYGLYCRFVRRHHSSSALSATCDSEHYFDLATAFALAPHATAGLRSTLTLALRQRLEFDNGTCLDRIDSTICESAACDVGYEFQRSGNGGEGNCGPI